MRKCGNALRLVLALLCVGTLWFWITNVWVAIIIYWRAGGNRCQDTMFSTLFTR